MPTLKRRSSPASRPWSYVAYIAAAGTVTCLSNLCSEVERGKNRTSGCAGGPLFRQFPVPVSAALCVPLCVLSVTTRLAVRLPLAVGLNATSMVQLLPAVSDDVQVLLVIA